MTFLALLGDLFAFPCLYQGWLLLFSAEYRRKRKSEWATKPGSYVIGDIGLIATCTLVEIIIALAIIYHLFVPTS